MDGNNFETTVHDVRLQLTPEQCRILEPLWKLAKQSTPYDVIAGQVVRGTYPDNPENLYLLASVIRKPLAKKIRDLVDKEKEHSQKSVTQPKPQQPPKNEEPKKVQPKPPPQTGNTRTGQQSFRFR